MSAAKDIKEMMDVWDFIIKTAKEQFPYKTEEEIYQIAKSAMNKQLGLDCNLREDCPVKNCETCDYT